MRDVKNVADGRSLEDVAAAINAMQAAMPRKRSQKRQRELMRHFGFPGGEAEIGHIVSFELRLRGLPPRICAFGAHLAAVASIWNYQGNNRIGRWMGYSPRSLRRYRAELEKHKLVRSCLLLRGDQLPGQSAPVRRPQVVRDVSALQRLAGARSAIGYTKRGAPSERDTRRDGAPTPRKPSAVETQQAPTVEEFERLQRQHAGEPWLASFLGAMAAAGRGGTTTPRGGQPQPTSPSRRTPPERRRYSAEELDAELRKLGHDPPDD